MKSKCFVLKKTTLELTFKETLLKRQFLKMDTIKRLFNNFIWRIVTCLREKLKKLDIQKRIFQNRPLKVSQKKFNSKSDYCVSIKFNFFQLKWNWYLVLKKSTVLKSSSKIIRDLTLSFINHVKYKIILISFIKLIFIKLMLL